MISGSHRSLRLLFLLWLLPPAAQAVEVDRIIERIKVSPPATIAFTEVRYSRLLKQPTIVSGTLGFLGSQQVDRAIERPYRERTEIRSESVRVIREGEPDRTFALTRSPELRILLRTFSALLGGDRPALERDFQLRMQGDVDAWTLELTPLDKNVQRRLSQVSIVGDRSEPRCFSLYTRDGGADVMLLGTGAGVTISPAISLDALLKLCRATR